MMGVMTHGPISDQLDKTHYDRFPSEHREASEETFAKDLFAAVTFWPQLAFETLSTMPQFEHVVKTLHLHGW